MALVFAFALSTVTFETSPRLNYLLGFVIASLVAALIALAAIVRSREILPLLIAMATLLALTVIMDYGAAPQRFEILLRYLTSIGALFAIRLAPIGDIRRCTAYVGMGLIAYASVVAARGGSFEYAGTFRIMPYWSGVASSSLTIAAVTVLIALAPIKRLARVLWVLAGLALLVGYGVVAPLIMVVMFFGGWFVVLKGWSRGWLYGVGVVLLAVGILFRDSYSLPGATIATGGVGTIGSGRLDAWMIRFVEFGDRDVIGKFLGLGPYSDYQYSTLWYWEEKNAHSDLLTLLMEFGVIGFVAVVAVAYGYYRRANALTQVGFIAVAFGTAATNALLDRPVVAVGWGFVLYACGYHTVGPRTSEAGRVDARSGQSVGSTGEAVL